MTPTIVTFTKEFLDSLSVGNHGSEVLIHENGTAKATITVVEKQAQQTAALAKKPAANQKKATRTGDGNPAMTNSYTDASWRSRCSWIQQEQKSSVENT